jgi:hypothetical protein
MAAPSKPCRPKAVEAAEVRLQHHPWDAEAVPEAAADVAAEMERVGVAMNRMEMRTTVVTTLEALAGLAVEGAMMVMTMIVTTTMIMSRMTRMTMMMLTMGAVVRLTVTRVCSAARSAGMVEVAAVVFRTRRLAEVLAYLTLTGTFQALQILLPVAVEVPAPMAVGLLPAAEAGKGQHLRRPQQKTRRPESGNGYLEIENWPGSAMKGERVASRPWNKNSKIPALPLKISRKVFRRSRPKTKNSRNYSRTGPDEMQHIFLSIMRWFDSPFYSASRSTDLRFAMVNTSVFQAFHGPAQGLLLGTRYPTSSVIGACYWVFKSNHDLQVFARSIICRTSSSEVISYNTLMVASLLPGRKHCKGENGYVRRQFLLDKQYENVRFYYMKRNNGHMPSTSKREPVAATSTDLLVKVHSAQNGMLATKTIRQRTPTQSGSEHTSTSVRTIYDTAY